MYRILVVEDEDDIQKILENKKITINNIGIINRKYYKKY